MTKGQVAGKSSRPLGFESVRSKPFIQFSFADEFDEITFIAVDEEEFVQPQSKYDSQEITIIGHVEDYIRGDTITLTITYPDETEEEINTFASKDGDIYTILHITHESQIGIHMIFVKFFKIILVFRNHSGSINYACCHCLLF